MSENGYLLAVILVMAVATFVTRLIPFIALGRIREHPLLLYLGEFTPPAVMMVLLVYSLKGVDLSRYPFGAEALCALVLTTLLHLWRGNALLSIFSGTLFYMAALQLALFG